MSNRENQRRLDDLALKYLAAVEIEDFDTIAAMWDQAADDADLDAMLHDLNAEIGAGISTASGAVGAICSPSTFAAVLICGCVVGVSARVEAIRQMIAMTRTGMNRDAWPISQTTAGLKRFIANSGARTDSRLRRLPRSRR